MSEFDEQKQVRISKLNRLRELEVEVYPHNFSYDTDIHSLKQRYADTDAAALEENKSRHTVPGRIVSIREHGKVTFLDLSDGKDRLQIYVKKQILGDDAWEQSKQLDLGDHIGVEGTLLRTRTGELTLFAERFVFLAKALRPLPEKFHGLADVELRYRRRYLDLIVNRDVRDIFETRSRIIDFLRTFFKERSFLEVETPMMQTIPGGAAAKPFSTHHNALDLDLYLRVAPELFLKRLIVGGIPRVFEINRNFRNEGISTRHNPEFTMLEFYEAYRDYTYLMALTEELLSSLVKEIKGSYELEYGSHSLDFTPPWDRVSIPEAVKSRVPGGPDPDNLDALRDAARNAGIPLNGDESCAALMMALFEHYVESTLIQPTFITGFPVELSPLAKGDETAVHRFELIIAGMELANAYCELNDQWNRSVVSPNRYKREKAGSWTGTSLMHWNTACLLRPERELVSTVW